MKKRYSIPIATIIVGIIDFLNVVQKIMAAIEANTGITFQ